MNPVTVRTLTWLAVFLLVAGSMITAPMANLILAGLSVVLGLLPLFFGAGRFRIVGLLLILAALGVMLNSYPSARNEWQRYTSRASR